jgi:hypothetical protein
VPHGLADKSARRRVPDLNKRFMHDFSLILDFEPWVYDQNTAFEKTLATHVEASDVVVTHHLPAFESVPPQFARSATNAYFVSDVSSYIRDHHLHPTACGDESAQEGGQFFPSGAHQGRPARPIVFHPRREKC